MEVKFKSSFSQQLSDYVTHLLASDGISRSPLSNLINFDAYCATHYPESKGLTQEMVDEWCQKRDSECNNSCLARIGTVCSFINYLLLRGMTSVRVPVHPVRQPAQRIPHIFTKEELQKFFLLCDSAETINGDNGFLLKIVLPVYFRLLLSTGMRTCEARWLKKENVDLVSGVINIKDSKGDAHRVVLHPTMLSILAKYDMKMEQVKPNRCYFFPDARDKPYKGDAMAAQFKKFWKMVSSEDARAYDFRHHYATYNISRIGGMSSEWYDDFVSISRSLGHKTLSSTARYYSASTSIGGKLLAKTETLFDKMFDNINYVDYETEK